MPLRDHWWCILVAKYGAFLFTEIGAFVITDYNKIRPLVLGRKNFLFACSNEGAKRIAMMYSFFASFKEADVNPYAWMTDTLNQIGNHPINKLSKVLPSNFQKL
jgi:hypothetical protein